MKPVKFQQKQCPFEYRSTLNGKILWHCLWA